MWLRGENDRLFNTGVYSMHFFLYAVAVHRTRHHGSELPISRSLPWIYILKKREHIMYNREQAWEGRVTGIHIYLEPYKPHEIMLYIPPRLLLSAETNYR